jgi:hypothetical protein
MDEQRYISGEAYKVTHNNKPSRTGASFMWVLVAIVVVAAVSIGVFVYLHKKPTNTSPPMQTTQSESSSGNITVPSGNNGGGTVSNGSGQSARGTESSGTPCLSAGPCHR